MGPIADSFEEVGALASTYRDLGDQIRVLVETGGSNGVGIGSTIDQVNRTLVRADQAFAAATDWLGDEQLREDAAQAVFKANLFIERATERRPRRADRRDPGPGVTRARAASPAGPFRRRHPCGDPRPGDPGIVGEGTVGRFLKDPALYEDLDEAARRLADTLATLRVLIDAVKAEGVGVEF